MPHEVKMPQLGMTQDSGIIMSWLKSAGEAVAVGDALFEVETDKATMEIEAPAEGYLAGIRRGEGDDVPVGDVIALIVETEADVAEHGSAVSAETAPTPESVSSPPEDAADTTDLPPPDQPDPTHVAERVPKPVPPIASGRKVLASPLAKRLAYERGIDLVTLRAAGVAEPIHAADLSKAQRGGQSTLSALVSGAALDALLDRSNGVNTTMLFAAFAAGAWRALFTIDDVGVAVRGLDGSTTVHANPDRGGGSGEAAALALVNLCETRLSGFAPAGGGVTLATARSGDGYALTLSFDEGVLQMPHAVALLDDIAARVEDPIRQLV